MVLYVLYYSHKEESIHKKGSTWGVSEVNKLEPNFKTFFLARLRQNNTDMKIERERESSTLRGPRNVEGGRWHCSHTQWAQKTPLPNFVRSFIATGVEHVAHRQSWHIERLLCWTYPCNIRVYGVNILEIREKCEQGKCLHMKSAIVNTAIQTDICT